MSELTSSDSEVTSSSDSEIGVSGLRIAVDIGGTFTDVVVTQGASIVHTAKVLTTYHDFLDAVHTGIEAGLSTIDGEMASAPWLLHATTLVSNALIERKGVPVSLLVTRGFEDLVHLGDGSRYDIWDLDVEHSKPFVGEPDVFGVSERMAAEGISLIEPDQAEIEAFSEELNESVAVVFLHSYANPSHERRIGEVLNRIRPNMEISLSSDISREVGEYERLTTTVANAFVKPLVKKYLDSLRSEANATLGSESRVLVMLSSGGLTPVPTAAKLPVRIVESGPAAGVTAAHAYVSMTPSLWNGSQKAVSLDMGGTTAKIAFLDGANDLRLRTTIEVARDGRYRHGSGVPLLVPSLDLIEIGAGGGSIARRDEFGLIEVGPESASSTPGPAAYGRGGTEPTVTDANVVLGYIPSWQQLGGTEQLFPELALDAVKALVLEKDSTVDDVALGIHNVANEHMAGALRVAAAERGLQADDHILVAFGGAAPLHACGVAQRVGIKKVLVPPEAGVFSALGLVLSPLSYEAVRPFRALLPLDRLTIEKGARLIAEMNDEIGEALAAQFQATVLADVRFAGQHTSLTVALGSEMPTSDELQTAFTAEYRRLYSRLPEVDGEVVALRVRGFGERSRLAPGVAHLVDGNEQGIASAYFEDIRTGEPVRHDVPVIQRAGTVAGGVGPAVISEPHTTTVVPPGWKWSREEVGALVLEYLDEEGDS